MDMSSFDLELKSAVERLRELVFAVNHLTLRWNEFGFFDSI